MYRCRKDLHIWMNQIHDSEDKLYKPPGFKEFFL